MSKSCPTTYRNATLDHDAQARAVFGAEYRARLEAIGFTFLGLLKVCPTINVKPEQAKKLLPGQDGEILAEALEIGEIVLLLVSPDKRAFASIENYYGEPIVSLQTLLEDGTVVETTLKPEHQLKRADVISEPDRAPGLMITALMKNTVGTQATWPRTNRPQAGYHVELLDSHNLADLWQRHQTNINRIDQQCRCGLRAHISMEIYMAICQRSLMIFQHCGRLNWISMNILMVIFFVGALSLISYTVRLVQNNQVTTLASVLMDVLLVVVFGGLVIGILSLVSRWLIPHLPGPARATAAELIQTVKNRYGF